MVSWDFMGLPYEMVKHGSDVLLANGRWLLGLLASGLAGKRIPSGKRLHSELENHHLYVR